MITLYGIKNCDTVKKARTWLEQHDVKYRFHDLRSDGLDEPTLQGWIKAVGWETLLNTRSTTWRQLPDASKRVASASQALPLLIAHPTLIKRPVLQHGKTVLVGFSAQDYANCLL